MTTKSENPLRQKDDFPAPGAPENVSPDSRSENARGEPFPALPCNIRTIRSVKTPGNFRRSPQRNGSRPRRSEVPQFSRNYPVHILESAPEKYRLPYREKSMAAIPRKAHSHHR